MGQKHQSSLMDLAALIREERERPGALVLDGLLLLGVLAWVALRVTVPPHPGVLAVYTALLVGAIVHRTFIVMERPRA
jgi:hypothetical protein